jgi:hypothetical protein
MFGTMRSSLQYRDPVIARRNDLSHTRYIPCSSERKLHPSPGAGRNTRQLAHDEQAMS